MTARADVRDATVLAGCMGLGGDWDDSPVTDEHRDQAEAMIEAALAAGIEWFDHADIYTRGKAEQVFGEVLAARPDLRDRVRLQTKCGILLAGGGGVMTSGQDHGRYDNSADHVRRSVEGSLQRLGVERLDSLLVHRPDPLTPPQELAGALDALVGEGLVGQVGVSNHSAAQVVALQRHLEQPLVVDQLEMSLAARDWVESGVLVNTPERAAVGFDHGSLESMGERGVRLQAWGALAGGRYSGRVRPEATGGEAEAERRTTEVVAGIAQDLQTTPESVVLGWLQAHPAGISPIVGSVTPHRLAACADAVAERVKLTRAQWYSMWVAARGGPLP